MIQIKEKELGVSYKPTNGKKKGKKNDSYH